MLSQGNDTFDDIKLKIHDFQLKGGPSYIRRSVSRKKRAETMDEISNGVDVGRYNPVYKSVDRTITTNAFAGTYKFLTD